MLRLNPNPFMNNQIQQAKERLLQFSKTRVVTTTAEQMDEDISIVCNALDQQDSTKSEKKLTDEIAIEAMKIILKSTPNYASNPFALSVLSYKVASAMMNERKEHIN